MERRLSEGLSRSRSAFEFVATFAVIAALLYLGAGIIVPVVLSVLLAFALTPMVNWLRRRLHFPDALAVIVSVLFAIMLLAGLAVLAGTQIANLAQELPGYQQTVSAKLEGLRSQFGENGLLAQFERTISDFTAQLQSNTTAERTAVPVVISNDAGPFGLLTSVLGSIIGPVATLAIVIIFLIFLLMGRSDLLDRFVRLVGSNDYAKANIAIADASKRVGRYLLMQLAVNCTYGTIFGLGLWIIGVPSAVLWGVLIVAFRYVPFIGALIIAVVPFLLAFAVDPGWNMLIASVALFVVLDQFTANVVEPRLYGSSTGVSPIAILLSAMFWATLWGPIGLILATPMTVCLVVIGRHLPQLRFFDTLLGSEPVLTPPEQLYQRMLKGDAEGAIEIMEDQTAALGERVFLETVLLQTLRLASHEMSDHPEANMQRRQLVQSFEAMIAEFEGESNSDNANVLLIGGKTELDECAARVMAVMLADEGIVARVLAPLAIRPEAIRQLDIDGIHSIGLVYLGDDIGPQVRYISRRLRRVNPNLALIVYSLRDGDVDADHERLRVDAVSNTIDDLDLLIASTQDSAKGSASRTSPQQVIGRDADRVAELLAAIAEKFGVAVATINLVDDERHREETEAFELTDRIVRSGEPVVYHSEAPDAEWAENGFLQTTGIEFYAGVPLAQENKEPFGVLTLLDHAPHRFGPAELDSLRDEASTLVRQLFAPRPVPHLRPVA